MTDINVLLRELAVNAARKARRWQALDNNHERGLAEVAHSIENWLHHRAPLLPGYDPDWQVSPKTGDKVYEFPWEASEEREYLDAVMNGEEDWA